MGNDEGLRVTSLDYFLIVIFAVVICGIFYGVHLRSRPDMLVPVVEHNYAEVSGGMTAINEYVRCYIADSWLDVDVGVAGNGGGGGVQDSFSFEPQTFARLSIDGYYFVQEELYGENVTLNMSIIDYGVLRLMNKEIDRQMESQNLTPGSDLECFIHSDAKFFIIVETDVQGTLQGEAGFDEDFRCTAPDGVHYQCDFDEKSYLWSMWRYVKDSALYMLVSYEVEE